MLAPPKIVRGTKEFLKPLSILQHPRGQDPHDQKLEMPKQIYNSKDVYVLRKHLQIYQHIYSKDNLKTSMIQFLT